MPRMPFTGPVTDEFGPRIHPISKVLSFHYGMDGVGFGNVAPADGKLIGYGPAGGYGNRAIFVDKYGWTHWLGHNDNDAPLVPIGTWLPEGARVAVMGTTGNSTGVHCHWETRRPTGEVVDPRVWLAETAASAPAGTDTTPIGEWLDMVSKQEFDTAIDRLRREDRARLYECTDHPGEYILIQEGLPSNDPGKVAYPTSPGQIASLENNYQFLADDEIQAKQLTHKQLLTVIALARATDPVFTPTANFA